MKRKSRHVHRYGCTGNTKQSSPTKYNLLFTKIVELGNALGVRCAEVGVWHVEIGDGVSIAVNGLQHAAPFLCSGSQAIIPVLHTALIHRDKIIGFVGPYRCKLIDGAGITEDDILKSIYTRISIARLDRMGVVVAGAPGVVAVGGVV